MCKQYFKPIGDDLPVGEHLVIPNPDFTVNQTGWTEPEDWRFTKDKPEFHESGRVYRKQVLATNSKQTRTVEVDIDNPDEIVRLI